MVLELAPDRSLDLADGIPPIPVMFVWMTIVFYLRVVGALILETKGAGAAGEFAEADLFLEIGGESSGAAKRGSLALV